MFRQKQGDKLYIRKVLFISKLTLVLVLGYVVARTVLLPERIEKSLAPASASGRDTVRINETMNPADLSFEDYAEIIERNPFGSSGRSTGEGERAPMANSVSDRELGLALFGTISGSPAVARAIIKNLKTNVFDLYKTGQVVGDARIESINTDTVILLYNGQRKVLRLNTARSGGYNDNNTRTPSSLTIGEIDLPAKKVGTDQTITGYVEAVLNKAVIEPYAVNGQIEGLRITGLENIKEAKDLGLKNGDVIRTVNGHRLTGKQKAYQVFKKAMSQPAMSLELLRDGKTRELSFALR